MNKKLLIALGLTLSPLTLAQSAQDAMQRVESIMADDQLRQKSYASGHERIRFCGYCHGEDGNSVRDYIPNLADQHPLYLFNQFEKFGDGRRDHYVMTKLAQTLSLEERIDIAVYYSQQKAKSRTPDSPSLAAEGEVIFKRYCTACHGEAGGGFKDMPRLAGQPAEYLESRLVRFKKMEPGDDITPMIGITDAFSEEDFERLAQYLQTL